VVEAKQTRVVLRRSKEARFLRGIGIAIYVGSIILFAGSLLSTNGFYWSVFLVCFLLVFLRGFLVSIREFFRKVVLLENYISFTTWGFVPRTYTYGQISEVETVVVAEDAWSIEPETYVKVTFEDGKVLKVQKSLMSVREFRKHLSEKAGRKFRKATKVKKIR
jgi:hypothetical protein